MRSARADCYAAKEASEQHTGSSAERGCPTRWREARAMSLSGAGGSPLLFGRGNRRLIAVDRLSCAAGRPEMMSIPAVIGGAEATVAGSARGALGGDDARAHPIFRAEPGFARLAPRRPGAGSSLIGLTTSPHG